MKTFLIKNLIFDFGNVLVRFQPKDIIRTACKAIGMENITEQEIALVEEAAFDRLYWDKMDAGTITDEECIAAVSARLPEKFCPLIAVIFDRWTDFLSPMEGMSELTKRWKTEGMKLFLVSNTGGAMERHYKELDILQQFDGLVLSAPIHLLKPTAEIFQYLLDTYHLKAEECLFIDDLPRNITGAEKCGIKGYLFDGDAERLEQYLREQCQSFNF